MVEVCVSGYSVVPPSRARVDRGEEALTAEEYHARVLSGLMQSVGIVKEELDGLNYALGLNRPLWPHALIWSGEVAQNLGLSPKFTFVSDHGGMSALNLVAQGYALIKSGYVDHVVLLGVDSPLTPAKPQGGYRLERTWRYELNYELPLGMIGPLSEAALLARRHIYERGTTAEQMGIVAVSQRKNASKNPWAYLKQPLTLDEYLKSPYLAEPIRMLDAVIPVNGGFALMLSRLEEAARFTDKPVNIDGIETQVNADPQNELRDITRLSIPSARLFDKVDLGLDDIDFLELYDDFTIVVLMQLEALGYAGDGGGRFVEKTSITHDGDLPVNTGGGQLSGGQAGTAGGFGLLVEAVQQLREEAGERQVKGAKRGLVTGLGCLGYNHNLVNTGVALL
ncbi:MAG: thiolase family protein, partial [Thermoprotei archaeon]